MTDPKLQPQLASAISALDIVLRLADRLVGDRMNEAHVHAIALHATIIELFAGCITLVREGYATGVPILLRSTYEALVDLDNLLHDASYAAHIEAANLKQMTKLVRQSRTNPLLRGLFERHAADLDLMIARLSELKRAGRVALTIEDRCKLAKRSDEYLSLYGLFCLDAHNNSAALADRHLEHTPDTSVITIKFLCEPDIPSVVRRLSFGTGFLVQSAVMIHEAFHTGATEIVELAGRHERERVAIWTE
jgi:hypothetical protein